MVQEMMEWLKGLPNVSFQTCITPALATALGARLLVAHRGQVNASADLSCEEPAAEITAKRVLLVDHSNFEAVAAGKILQMLLAPLYGEDVSSVPYLLPPEAAAKFNWKLITESLIVLCTSGVFHSKDVLLSLCLVGDASLQVVPILADEKFRFPSPEFLDELKPIADKVAAQAQTDANTPLTVVRDIFSEIAIVFQPEQYSSTEAVLRTKAQELVERLRNSKSRCLGNSTTRSNVSSDAELADNENDWTDW